MATLKKQNYRTPSNNESDDDDGHDNNTSDQDDVNESNVNETSTSSTDATEEVLAEKFHNLKFTPIKNGGEESKTLEVKKKQKTQTPTTPQTQTPKKEQKAQTPTTPTTPQAQQTESKHIRSPQSTAAKDLGWFTSSSNFVQTLEEKTGLPGTDLVKPCIYYLENQSCTHTEPQRCHYVGMAKAANDDYTFIHRLNAHISSGKLEIDKCLKEFPADQWDIKVTLMESCEPRFQQIF